MVTTNMKLIVERESNMQYAVINCVKDDEFIMGTYSTLEDAKKRWKDEVYYTHRDGKDNESHIVFIPDYESGNYDYLEERKK